MHPSTFALIALDIANERTREADYARLARLVDRGRPSRVRRLVGATATAASVAVARLAVRLDDRARPQIAAVIGGDAFETDSTAVA